MATVPIVRTRSNTSFGIENRIGLQGEVEHDITQQTLVVHDGSHRGGTSLLRSDFANIEPAEGRKALEITPVNIGAEVWRGFRDVSVKNAISLLENNYFFTGDTGGGVLNVSLPSARAAGIQFHVLITRKGNAGGSFYLNAETPETVNGGSRLELENVGDAVILQSNGENWEAVRNGSSDVGVSTFLELTDTPGDYGTSGQVLRRKPDGSGLEWFNLPPGSGGSPNFIGLTDTPDNLGTDNQILIMDGSNLVWENFPSIQQAALDNTTEWEKTKIPSDTMFLTGNTEDDSPEDTDRFVFTDSGQTGRKYIGFSALRSSVNGAQPWVSGNSYGVGNLATHNGVIYWCHNPVSSSSTPPSEDYNETHWKRLDGVSISAGYSPPSIDSFGLSGVATRLAIGDEIGGIGVSTTRDLTGSVSNFGNFKTGSTMVLNLREKLYGGSWSSPEQLEAGIPIPTADGAWARSVGIDAKQAADGYDYEWTLSFTDDMNGPRRSVFTASVPRSTNLINSQTAYWGAGTRPTGTTAASVFSDARTDTPRRSQDVAFSQRTFNADVPSVPANEWFWIATPDNREPTSLLNRDLANTETIVAFRRNVTEFQYLNVTYKVYALQNVNNRPLPAVRYRVTTE